MRHYPELVLLQNTTPRTSASLIQVSRRIRKKQHRNAQCRAPTLYLTVPCSRFHVLLQKDENTGCPNDSDHPSQTLKQPRRTFHSSPCVSRCWSQTKNITVRCSSVLLRRARNPLQPQYHATPELPVEPTVVTTTVTVEPGAQR